MTPEHEQTADAAPIAPAAPTPADLWAMGVTETHQWRIEIAGAHDYNEATRTVIAPTAADAITIAMQGTNPGRYAKGVRYLGMVKIDRTGGLIP